MARLNGVGRFAILLLAGLGVLLIVLRLIEYGFIPNLLVPYEITKFVAIFTAPPPFSWLREWMAKRFAYNSVATHLFISASETLRYQGFYLLCLLLARKNEKRRPFSSAIAVTGFTGSVLVFAIAHYEITLPLAAGVIFNLLVLRYRRLPSLMPLLPAFFLHLLWNLLPPPIPTLF